MRSQDEREGSVRGIGLLRNRAWLRVRMLAVMRVGTPRVKRQVAVPAEVNGLFGVDRAAALRAN